MSQEQLNNQIYLIRFSHTSALLLKKNRHKADIFPVLQNLTHMCVSDRCFGMSIAFISLLSLFLDKPDTPNARARFLNKQALLVMSDI